MSLDKDLINKFINITSKAAIATYPYIGKKNKLLACQCSSRGGLLKCQLLGDRVLIGGSSVRYMDGKITL